MILYISTGDGVLGYDAVQGVPKKMCPLQYMFTVYFIFTENSIKLCCSMLKKGVFKYILIAIMHFGIKFLFFTPFCPCLTNPFDFLIIIVTSSSL